MGEILRRSHYAAEIGEETVGKEVTLCGWVARQRDLGGLIFVDLRDRTGIVQLAFDDGTERAVFDAAFALRGEFVIGARGVVRLRESPNPELPTGLYELDVRQLRVFSTAEVTPFEIIDELNTNEELRLKYRYLDLRRLPLQRNIRMRHEIARVTRDYFYENGFLEIETPQLIKSTPEGARDYVVPSRLHHGNFYALPQSPQIYKQLLMLAGFDRYIQLARCFRDEDLRADRQPEFTQVDIEMSFVDMEDIFEVVEGYVGRLMGEILGREIALPLPKLTYKEAMERFGSDKPDTRFGMELCDISDLAGGCGFGVFESAIEAGGSVRAIVAKGSAAALTRKEIDRLVETAKGIGAKGLAFIRFADEEPSCSFAKFLAPGRLEEIMARIGCEKGDTAFFAADRDNVVFTVLGGLRNILGRQLGLIDDTKFNFLWVTQMPFFEFDEESSAWVAMHHPFTMPMEECMDFLESDPGRVTAKAYDLVVNGVELCSGSIRISDWRLQDKMFALLGLSKEQIEAKFGFLVDAYRYGAPPHGGVGLGLDRIVMVLCGADSLRDITAFPKLQNASEPMSRCPSPIDEAQLAELGIRLAGGDEK